MTMELSRGTLAELSALIHRLCGLVVGPDKAYLVRHRLEPLVRAEGLAGFDELLERLRGRGGPRLHDAIIEAITTKETRFFRDRALFEALRRVVLPERAAALRSHSPRRHRIRIWSAGCSTGQECYSVAMLVRELAAPGGDGLRDSSFTILGSDISSAALEAARAGEYSQTEVQRGVPAELLERYFVRSGRRWSAAESLRRLVQFQRFDLLQSPAALGAFDVILCRNVLIYFDDATRRRVCRGFQRLLQQGGWLALGSAESLLGMHEGWDTVRAGGALLYRKAQAGG